MQLRASFLVLPFSACLLLACSKSTMLLETEDAGADGAIDSATADTAGGDSSTTDSATDTGGGDGSVDSSSDTGGADSTVDAATCATATEGASCTGEGTRCGGPCTDACSFCNILTCTGGMWERMEAFPAPCFSCGPTQQCQAYVQYCTHLLGGPSMESFTCEAAPAGCEGGVTCACLSTAGVGGDCAEPNPGETTVTVTVMDP